jgi:hypothetical protein
MKITALKESTNFTTLDIEKLFSKLKSHELCSKILITSAHVGAHDVNPTNTTISFTLEFVLSSLVVASDEQYESIPDDEIALLVRKF